VRFMSVPFVDEGPGDAAGAAATIRPALATHYAEL
jgi:hypothetical protein